MRRLQAEALLHLGERGCQHVRHHDSPQHAIRSSHHGGVGLTAWLDAGKAHGFPKRQPLMFTCRGHGDGECFVRPQSARLMMTWQPSHAPIRRYFSHARRLGERSAPKASIRWWAAQRLAPQAAGCSAQPVLVALRLASSAATSFVAACAQTVAGSMASMRDFVSGAGCSADGASGSGAANPAASFANALLGGTAKAHEGQLRQPPGACVRTLLRPCCCCCALLLTRAAAPNPPLQLPQAWASATAARAPGSPRRRRSRRRARFRRRLVRRAPPRAASQPALTCHCGLAQRTRIAALPPNLVPTSTAPSKADHVTRSSRRQTSALRSARIRRRSARSRAACSRLWPAAAPARLCRLCRSRSWACHRRTRCAHASWIRQCLRACLRAPGNAQV